MFSFSYPRCITKENSTRLCVSQTIFTLIYETKFPWYFPCCSDITLLYNIIKYLFSNHHNNVILQPSSTLQYSSLHDPTLTMLSLVDSKMLFHTWAESGWMKYIPFIFQLKRRGTKYWNQRNWGTVTVSVSGKLPVTIWDLFKIALISSGQF